MLAYPKIWSLHLTALVIRSKLESDQHRAVERSMTQLQELVDGLAKTEPHASRRLEYFYVSRMPLEWELQGALADVFLRLGAVNSALDIYLRLKMWDKVIGCYQNLELKHKVIYFKVIVIPPNLCNHRLFHSNRQKRLYDRNWLKKRRPNCGVSWVTVRMMSPAMKKLGNCLITRVLEPSVTGPFIFIARNK